MSQMQLIYALSYQSAYGTTIIELYPATHRCNRQSEEMCFQPKQRTSSEVSTPPPSPGTNSGDACCGGPAQPAGPEMILNLILKCKLCNYSASQLFVCSSVAPVLYVCGKGCRLKKRWGTCSFSNIKVSIQAESNLTIKISMTKDVIHI